MTIDEARTLLDEIAESRYEGTKWEENFMLDLIDSIDNGYNPSPKRSEILQQIHKKAMK